MGGRRSHTQKQLLTTAVYINSPKTSRLRCILAGSVTSVLHDVLEAQVPVPEAELLCGCQRCQHLQQADDSDQKLSSRGNVHRPIQVNLLIDSADCSGLGRWFGLWRTWKSTSLRKWTSCTPDLRAASSSSRVLPESLSRIIPRKSPFRRLLLPGLFGSFFEPFPPSFSCLRVQCSLGPLSQGHSRLAESR